MLQPRTFATISAAYWSAFVAIEPAGVVAGGKVMPRSAAVMPVVGGATSATNSAVVGAGVAPRSTDARSSREAGAGQLVRRVPERRRLGGRQEGAREAAAARVVHGAVAVRVEDVARAGQAVRAQVPLPVRALRRREQRHVELLAGRGAARRHRRGREGLRLLDDVGDRLDDRVGQLLGVVAGVELAVRDARGLLEQGVRDGARCVKPTV